MIPLTDPLTHTWRRHSDPPGMWAKLLAGSVVFHVLLFASLRGYVVRISTPTSTNTDIAIELVEEAPEATTATEPSIDSLPVQEPSTDSVVEAPAEPAPDSEDAIAIAPDTLTSAPQNSALPEPAPSLPATTPVPNLDPQSSGDRSTALPFSPPTLPPPSNIPPATPPQPPVNPPPTIPPAPLATPNPVAPPIASPTPSPSPVPSEPSPVPTPPATPPSSEPVPSEGAIATQPDSPDNGGIPTLQGVPLPEPPVPADSGEVATNPNPDSSVPLEQAPVESEATPAGFTASIVNVSSPTDVPDVPAYPAQPKASSEQFLADAASSACLLTPDSANYFGQSVALRITVDDQGRVLEDATQVRQPSGSGDYDQLAICVINGWQFSPAFNRTDSGDSPVFSNLDVSLTISPL